MNFFVPGLDKFGMVFEKTNWDYGTDGVYFHQSCVKYMQTKRALDQAKKRLQTEMETCSKSTCSTSLAEAPGIDKVITRGTSGPLQSKELCVWCMGQPEKKSNVRHPSPFHRIEQLNSWMRFKRHTVYLEDNDMRERILALIMATPDQFATEIYYHLRCWKKYMKQTYEPINECTHAQNVKPAEVDQMFLNHVSHVIFDLNEPRTLQGLLEDYKYISSNFGISCDGSKSSTVKRMLANEFQDKIGFHDRYHRNQSILVYDKSQGGSFIEAAINAWGISDEQLLILAAQRLKSKISADSSMEWPPKVEEVAADEVPNSTLVKFLCWLENPSSKEINNCKDPHIVCLASLLESHISRKRTLLKTKITCTLYGLTRSREVIDLMRKLGICISYADIKNLYATWASREIELGCCPEEIAENVPGTAIMDNDDFKCDSLTGEALTDHRTNVMLVQPEHLVPQPKSNSRPLLVSHASLKNAIETINNVRPYKTITKGVPTVLEKFNTKATTTCDIRTDEIIHTLSRMDINMNNILPQEQKVGSFAGFQSLLHRPVMKSKPYYFLTFPKPPKKSVTHEVMMRLLDVVEEKNMPFIQLVGDQPVYTIIVQLRNENKEKFKKIIPILGPFHTQVSFITAINKRFSGSGLSDIIVAADIIADKSVDQAIRGKHYRRIVRALQLTYEALQRRIIQNGIQNGLQLSEQIQNCLEKIRDPFCLTTAELQEYVRDLK